jgi:hypothetical protein
MTDQDAQEAQWELDVAADRDRGIVGYVSSDGMNFMPLEIFHSWKHAAPQDRVEQYRPVAWLT